MRRYMKLEVEQLADKLIDMERTRQIYCEGWSRKNDDIENNEGELLQAAICYFELEKGEKIQPNKGVPTEWPWQRKWWKPKTKMSNLVRAGALCVAEIERLNRKPKPRKQELDQAKDTLRLVREDLIKLIQQEKNIGRSNFNNLRRKMELYDMEKPFDF